MKTTDLFDFRFVDRINEKKVLEAFLSRKSENVLWIKGYHGFGKTDFFQHVIKQHNEYKLCYLDIKKNETDIDILSNFIKALQNLCDIDFITNVTTKYKYFYDFTYKKTKTLSSELFPQISNYVSAILDLTYYAVTYQNETKNPLDMVSDYLDLILSNEKLCVCIDNFSRCNNEMAQHFFQIIKKNLENENFRACIITTSEDMNSELNEMIYYQLPYTDIKIKGLEKFIYFHQILDPIFDLNNFSKEDFLYLYQKCEGSPKKLSTTISKLLEKNGISLFKHSKAKIDKTVLFHVLQTNHVKFEDSDFSPVQKWIIFSYLCLTPQCTVVQIKELALYISKRIFFYKGYDENTFDKELLLLINNKILSYSDGDTISTWHDLDYIELSDIFKESTFRSMFSQYTYEFLVLHPEYFRTDELLCKHARLAGIPGWEKLNFRYGKKLFYQRRIYDAQRILSGLSINKLRPVQLLFVCLVAYDTGNYELAINYFQLINPDTLRWPRLKYYYYFYYGKSYNNIGNTISAINMIEIARDLVKNDKQLYVYTQNILHMYYFEVPEKIKDSEKIFNDIRLNYEKTCPLEWANTMRGCQNFLDNETALMLLNRAETLLDNELEKAFLKTTVGFVHIKSNQYEEAKNAFKKASETIKRLKIHEFSYAANNWAICHMMRKDYQTAKEILLEALLWNKTLYGSLVIQTHLMVCSFYLSDDEETNYYFSVLEKYMENHKVIDPIINRKIYMNLAIISKNRGHSIAANFYFNSVKPFVENSSSEWRYQQLTVSDSSKVERPNIEYLQITDFDPWFLIYAHD